MASGRSEIFRSKASGRFDEGCPLYLIIYHRLEHDLRSKVRDAVNEAITEMRASRGDTAADYRRSLREVA